MGTKETARVQKYKNERYKRVPLDLDKQEYEEIKTLALANGFSVNGFIKHCIRTVSSKLREP